MEESPGIPPASRTYRRLIRWWFTLTRRKIRVLQAGDMTAEGPVLFAVSQPAGFLQALVMATAIERPVHCLLPRSFAHSLLARFLSRRMGIILHDGDEPTSEAALQEALRVLSRGGALVVFAYQSSARRRRGRVAGFLRCGIGQAGGSAARGCQVAVHPMHLFLTESAAKSREVLIYVDSVVDRPTSPAAALSPDTEAPALAAVLEARFRENAFQLRPSNLEQFLSDLEEVLRTGLKEDWESIPDWKQDAEGFVLSRLAAEWLQRTNYLDPGRLVTLRKSLDDYRRLQRDCALRELEVEKVDSMLHSGWRQTAGWLETLLGLPIALYGLLNHLAIGLVLFLAGSFKRGNGRARSREWTLRGAVALGFYAFQIFLVAHRWGRAAAGYYAPTLPVSGAYLWRYIRLLGPQARLLFVSLTIPVLSKKIKRLRRALLEEVDGALGS